MNSEQFHRMSDAELATLLALITAILAARGCEPDIRPKHGGGGGP